MYMGRFDPTIILLIIGAVITLIAQFRVNRVYKVYAKVKNRRNITGMQAARKVLDNNGLQNVQIEMVQGKLTDHYDPKDKSMRLSEEVYNGTTVASVSIAAHEAGHAIQDGVGYKFLNFRNTMVPAVNFSSNISWVLIIVGLLIGITQGLSIGTILFDVGIIFFLVVILFHLVTLPVEFNASSRAIQQLESLGIVGSDEIAGSKKVLSAAAMTYVAALAVAVLNLARLLLIRGRD